MTTLWVGLGGAVGSIARYHVGRFAQARASSFPWGTLAVNVLGCFVISVLAQLALRGRIDETMRVGIGIGLVGGFTTYSTFNQETITFIEGGQWGRAGLYLAVTLVGGLVLGAAGWLVGRAVTG